MSYSYIKSVFPNFENSQNFQQTVYNNINLDKKYQTPQASVKQPSAYNDQELTQFVKELIEPEKKKTYEKSLPTERDNLRFYNPPIPKENLLQNCEQPPVKSIEMFNNEESKGDDCNIHMKHVLDCEKCRSILMKHWNMEQKKMRNQEMIDILAYILFGILIIVLIDNLSKLK